MQTNEKGQIKTKISENAIRNYIIMYSLKITYNIYLNEYIYMHGLNEIL